MGNESAAHRDDLSGEDASAKPVIGTLAGLPRDGVPLVEFDGPDGEERRCSATTLVPIDADMIGQPVELRLVGELERPVITKVIDVREVLRAEWDDLGRKVLGDDPSELELTELLRELRVLACTAAWIEADGVITYGALRIGTSRKSLREHVRRWKRLHPRLGPPLRPEKDTDEPGVLEAVAEPTSPDVSSIARE